MIVYAGEQFNSNFLLQCQNRDNFFDAKGLRAIFFWFHSLILHYQGTLSALSRRILLQLSKRFAAQPYNYPKMSMHQQLTF
jgi:hypothetical protein